MLGNLTTKEASQLSRRLLAWRVKNKKSWAQAALDFSVSRLTLLAIRRGAQCRVETARKICKVIGWRTFRQEKKLVSLARMEELQRSASAGSMNSCPLLLLQVLHAAASNLYLRLRLKGYTVQLSLPDQTLPLTSWVVLTSPARLPLLHVEFFIKDRNLRYRLVKCAPDGSPQRVGEGYLSDEGLGYCEEFLTSYASGPLTQTTRQRSVRLFNAAQQNAKRTRRK